MFPQLGMRGRLLMSAVLPAILMVLMLELVFLNHYQDDLERSFQERGMATVRQIGAAAEYAIFSGSRETLLMLAESTRQGDPAINSVSVLDRHGHVLVRSGELPRQSLPLSDSLQIHKADGVTTVQTPIQQASLVLNGDSEVWRGSSKDARASVTGYILVEISRAELAARQREMMQITLVIMLGGLLLASWLSLRIAGGVLASLDAAHTALRRQKEYAELLARTDALTGLANRRAFDEAAEQEVQRARRYNTPLALVMADLDHFKAINDRHGHHVGDQVLQHFAHILSASVRNLDLVGRWGGEEFAILMPGTDLEEAAQAAERMRQAVLAAAPPLDDRECAYTASFGVAAFRAETPTMISLLGRADTALYQAKKNGRNRVEQG
ncbi:MAG: diguanylate cyclase [Pseudomonadota bacterium]